MAKYIYTVEVGVGYEEQTMHIGTFLKESIAVDLARKWNALKKVKPDGEPCDFWEKATVFRIEPAKHYMDITPKPDAGMWNFELSKGRKTYTRKANS